LLHLPTFTTYYDYDFRNATAIELLEDAFWESSFSSYNQYDYLAIGDNFKKNIYDSPVQAKRESYFLPDNQGITLASKPLINPITKDLNSIGGFYSNSLQLDDAISNSLTLNTENYSVFPLINANSYVDDSYINYKAFVSTMDRSNDLPINISFNSNWTHSYTSVLNNFRADFEDNSLYQDTSGNAQTGFTDSSLFDTIGSDKNVIDILEFNNNLIEPSNNTRVANPVTLRKTAKNSIVTYNALQKVFRTRFDEGRSNTSIGHFSDLSVKQPFLTEGRVPYEKLLGKNTDSFYNISFYKSNTFSFLNDWDSSSTLLNSYMFDIPFLKSLKSDPSRYL